MRERKSILALVPAASLLLLAACGGNGDVDTTGGAAEGDPDPDIEPSEVDWLTERDTPVEEADGVVEDATLRVRFYDELSTLDPAQVFRVESENIAFNVFSGLVTYEGVTGDIIPDLATSWETEDNQTWTFELRDDVSFHDDYGDFTSADVEYSINRIADPDTGSPYASDVQEIVDIETPDDYTVVFELEEPNANFLHIVANYHQGQIVSEEAVEELGDDFGFNPVGTGPYQFTDYQQGTSFALERFDDYHGGPASIERIEYSIITDDETAAISLQNGEVDLVMRQQGDDRILQLAEDGYRMYFLEEYGIPLNIFNQEVEPLDDPLVRQAWAHAIDWETINETLTPVTQSRAHNMLPSWMDVYTDDIPIYDYDPERSLELLEEAGLEDGFQVTFLGRTSDGITEDQQFQQSYLAEVGIDLEFELVDTPVNNERRNNGDFEVTTRLLPAVNPDMILFSYLAPENVAPAGLNGARYDNQDVYELMLQARAEVDDDTRMDLYAEVQREVLEEVPYVPGLANNNIWPAATNVRGVALNPLAQVNLHDVYLIED